MARLGSGHRVVEIARSLEVPAAVPASALQRDPFLMEESFTLGNERPPKMLADGAVAKCMPRPLASILWFRARVETLGV
eukprot:7038421-Pyramimonas_sp.AAC.1